MTLVPYIIEDTGRGERAMDIFSRLLKDRVVFIGSEIHDQMANAVIAQLLFLRAEDAKKPISLYIHSPGGVISAGLAIYDTMQYIGCPIHTFCIGMAASMGALLLSAGTKGHRYALPHSRIMIHQPSGGVTGTSQDILLQSREILMLKEICSTIMAETSGLSKEKVLELSERDFWMSPAQAIERGFIDHIANHTPKVS